MPSQTSGRGGGSYKFGGKSANNEVANGERMEGLSFKTIDSSDSGQGDNKASQDSIPSSSSEEARTKTPGKPDNASISGSSSSSCSSGHEDSTVPVSNEYAQNQTATFKGVDNAAFEEGEAVIVFEKNNTNRTDGWKDSVCVGMSHVEVQFETGGRRHSKARRHSHHGYEFPYKGWLLSDFL